jgi:site-specific recombinase XerD
MPNRFYNIERPRKEHKLPTIISKQEVLSIIEVTKNNKHKCMIQLLYSAGIRKTITPHVATNTFKTIKNPLD